MMNYDSLMSTFTCQSYSLVVLPSISFLHGCEEIAVVLMKIICRGILKAGVLFLRPACPFVSEYIVSITAHPVQRNALQRCGLSFALYFVGQLLICSVGWIKRWWGST